MTLRTATIVIGLLDTLAWLIAAAALFMSGSDPATKGLDTGAGVVVTGAYLLTVPASLVLVVKRRAPWIALALALAFPAGFVLLLLAAIAFM